MQDAKQRPMVVVDRYTRVCLTAIAALLTVLVIGLWAEGPIAPDPAGAAGAVRGVDFTTGGSPPAQRAAMITALKATNKKLDKMISVLTSGEVKVIVVEGKNARAKAKKPAR
ncbi:hypothetical protein LCGC14_3039930 [marine sediment metagenome]|uniref:Uncharacterized protein n=1 Tax=marine sediment metagenome TaxID=412755 RepID=A0A0F8YXY8_9ZZZZ